MKKRYVWTLILAVEIIFALWWWHYISETNNFPGRSYIHQFPVLYTSGSNFYDVGNIVLYVSIALIGITVLVGAARVVLSKRR